MSVAEKALVRRLRDAAGRGDEREVNELLAAGASPDEMSDYGYPVDVAVRRGHTSIARLLLGAMRSPSAIRDLVRDLSESDAEWAYVDGEDAERFERLLSEMSERLGLQGKRAFVECTRNGSTDPRATRGILPLVAVAHRMFFDRWGDHVRGVVVRVGLAPIEAYFERAGAIVVRDAARSHFKPVLRGLALVEFHDVPWTWLALIGTQRDDATQMARSLAASLAQTTLSIERQAVYEHHPDGTDHPVLAHELGTPDGPFVPYHFVEQMRGRVSLRVQGVAARHVRRVSAVVLESLSRPVLSEDDRLLVDRVIASCG